MTLAGLARSVYQWLELVQEPLYVAQTPPDPLGAGPVLVEVDVERAGHVEQPSDVLISDLVGQSIHRVTEQRVGPVAPSALFRNGLHHLRRGPPTFLRRLAHVAGVKFGSGLLQQVPAGFAVLLSSHGSLILPARLDGRPRRGSGCPKFPRARRPGRAPASHDGKCPPDGTEVLSVATAHEFGHVREHHSTP